MGRPSLLDPTWLSWKWVRTRGSAFVSPGRIPRKRSHATRQGARTEPRASTLWVMWACKWEPVFPSTGSGGPGNQGVWAWMMGPRLGPLPRRKSHRERKQPVSRRSQQNKTTVVSAPALSGKTTDFSTLGLCGSGCSVCISPTQQPEPLHAGKSRSRTVGQHWGPQPP